MQLVLPDMVARRRGAIVNVSSLAAFVPGEGPYARTGPATAFAYGATKAALQHLTQSVALEVAPHGVAVNALLPSEPVPTPGNLVVAPGTERWGSAEDFAEAAVQPRPGRPRRHERRDRLERGRAAPRARSPRLAARGCPETDSGSQPPRSSATRAAATPVVHAHLGDGRRQGARVGLAAISAMRGPPGDGRRRRRRPPARRRRR